MCEAEREKGISMNDAKPQCGWCGKLVDKCAGEINRAHRLQRKIFCNRACAGMAHRGNPSLVMRNTKHGLKSHPLYKVWKNMKARCGAPSSAYFHRYGGRGISVCEAWRKSFSAFYEWASANGWAKHLQIDRIDNDGNYEPDNCRFVTCSINSRSRSTTKLAAQQVIEIRKSIEPRSLLAERYGVSQSLIGAIQRIETWKDLTAA